MMIRSHITVLNELCEVRAGNVPGNVEALLKELHASFTALNEEEWKEAREQWWRQWPEEVRKRKGREDEAAV